MYIQTLYIKYIRGNNTGLYTLQMTEVHTKWSMDLSVVHFYVIFSYWRVFYAPCTVLIWIANALKVVNSLPQVWQTWRWYESEVGGSNRAEVFWVISLRICGTFWSWAVAMWATNSFRVAYSTSQSWHTQRWRGGSSCSCTVLLLQKLILFMLLLWKNCMWASNADWVVNVAWQTWHTQYGGSSLQFSSVL